MTFAPTPRDSSKSCRLLDRFPGSRLSLSMQRASAFGLASCLALFSFSIPAAAVEIVSPKNGDVLRIGSEVVVQVRPSPADDIVRVYLGSSEDEMKYNDATGFFEQHIKLRGDAWGPIEIDVRSINSKNVIST